MTYLVEISYSNREQIKVRAIDFKMEIGHIVLMFSDTEFTVVPFHNVHEISIKQEDDE